MSEGRRWLERFWFCPAPAARLALLRILIGGYALWYVGQRYSMFIGIAGSRKSLFEPVGVAALLDGPISPALLRAILGVTITLNVAFIAGFRFRVVGPLFAGFLLFVLSYRNSWSMIYHSQNLVVLHVIVLGLTPAANALSLDMLGRSRWGGSVLWQSLKHQTAVNPLKRACWPTPPWPRFRPFEMGESSWWTLNSITRSHSGTFWGPKTWLESYGQKTWAE